MCSAILPFRNLKGSFLMNILVTNDDGIFADGIMILAETAKKFGDVTVVAPVRQCSGMSQKLTIAQEMEVREIEDYPVKGVKAYSLDGTPVDCVKTAVLKLLPQKPDVVFSGINFGYNAGFDCAYSGTIGAANEALLNGIPAIAYSNGVAWTAVFDGKGANYEVVEEYIEELTAELLNTEIEKSAMWSINFPGCPLDGYKGILRDRKVANLHPYKDNLVEARYEDGRRTYSLRDCIIDVDEAPEGSDIEALLNGYISIGKVYNAMLL